MSNSNRFEPDLVTMFTTAPWVAALSAPYAAVWASMVASDFMV